jgi:RNA polymerase sigma-70 factor, ECF subfamily
VEDLTHTLEVTLRRERGRIVGTLLRVAGDLGAAEDALHEAALSALRTWPAGVPKNPGAWLTTSAKHVLLDRRRHIALAERSAAAVLGAAPEATFGPEDDDGTFADDCLRLLFTSCHPALPLDSQIALTLKVVVGFSTAEIARAFTSSEATVAQRILRARKALSALGVAYQAPEPSALRARVEDVLGVLYAIFNEGHVAHAGPLMRTDLQHEALRLGRLLTDLAPGEPEVLGLCALMAFGAARASSRVDETGLPVLLAYQDRERWDRALIREGLVHLESARAADGQGRYTFEAEIAAQHITAGSWEATDWPRIVALYDTLLAREPSAVVGLHRAVALAMRDGPQAGLEALAPLRVALAKHALFYAVRADLRARAGRDGRADLRRALALTTNEGERALVVRRLEALGR